MTEVIYTHTKETDILDEIKFNHKIEIPNLEIDEISSSLEEAIIQAEKRVAGRKKQQEWERKKITNLLNSFKKGKIERGCSAALKFDLCFEEHKVLIEFRALTDKNKESLLCLIQNMTKK